MTRIASHLQYEYGKQLEAKPARDGFGTALVELGHENPDVVVFDADLAKSTRTEWFWKEFPERFFDAGIAEQNMLCMCAGMAGSPDTVRLNLRRVRRRPCLGPDDDGLHRSQRQTQGPTLISSVSTAPRIRRWKRRAHPSCRT